MIKNPPANAEGSIPGFQSLAWEDPLEEKMAPHPTILAWEIPWTEEHGRLKSVRLQSRMQLSNWAHTQTFIYIPETITTINIVMYLAPKGFLMPLCNLSPTHIIPSPDHHRHTFCHCELVCIFWNFIFSESHGMYFFFNLAFGAQYDYLEMHSCVSVHPLIVE